jgi:hypothetical protein
MDTGGSTPRVKGGAIGAAEACVTGVPSTGAARVAAAAGADVRVLAALVDGLSFFPKSFESHDSLAGLDPEEGFDAEDENGLLNLEPGFDAEDENGLLNLEPGLDARGNAAGFLGNGVTCPIRLVPIGRAALPGMLIGLMEGGIGFDPVEGGIGFDPVALGTGANPVFFVPIALGTGANPGFCVPTITSSGLKVTVFFLFSFLVVAGSCILMMAPTFEL